MDVIIKDKIRRQTFLFQKDQKHNIVNLYCLKLFFLLTTLLDLMLCCLCSLCVFHVFTGLPKMLVIRDYFGIPSPHGGPPLGVQMGDIIELVCADPHSSWWQV